MTATNMCYNFVGLKYSPPLERRAPKLVWGLLKHIAVILMSRKKINVNTPLSPGYGVEKRRDHRTPTHFL